jgi:NADPH2:quinone reductase
MPKNFTFEQAAGLYVTYPTSYAALVLRANLKAGEYCLVHAAAGGVGIAAVQIAHALGAKVIATAGTAEKLEIAKKNGADYVINYRDKDWHEQVKKITNGHGADVVYDPVGLVEQR